jgi:hypothetical protein
MKVLLCTAFFLAGLAGAAQARQPLAPVNSQPYACPTGGGFFHHAAALRCCDIRMGCAHFIDTTRARIAREAPRT